MSRHPIDFETFHTITKMAYTLPGQRQSCEVSYPFLKALTPGSVYNSSTVSEPTGGPQTAIIIVEFSQWAFFNRKKCCFLLRHVICVT